MPFSRSESDPRGRSADSSSWADPMVDFDRLLADIDARREALGMSLAQAAREAGVDPSKLSVLRKGGGISINNMCRLCDWLGRGVDDYRQPRSAQAQREIDLYNQTQALIKAGDVEGLKTLLMEGNEERVDEMMDAP